MIGFIFRHPVLTAIVVGIGAVSLTDSSFTSAAANGRALTAEVLGSDLNGSGLRDDVEGWIRGLYPNASHPIRVAAEQLGKAYQFGMRAFHENSSQKGEALQAYGIAHACIEKHFSPEAGEKIFRGIEKAMGDSAERVQYIISIKAGHARTLHSTPNAYACPY